MKRLPVALFAMAFLLAACAGTSTASLPAIPSVTVPSGAIPSLASAAADALCDASSPTSLTSIAGQLDTVAATTDTTTIEANLATLLANLQSSTVSGLGAPARDAAVIAVTQLQTTIKDPNARQAAATSGAASLRTAATSLC